jgi:hypothetical protein
MTFIRFEIIDFDIFQKVTHDYKQSKINRRIVIRIKVTVTVIMNKARSDDRNKELLVTVKLDSKR